MSHPLADIINQAEGFLLIGDSAAERFPALSFHAYTRAGKTFYCLDMGGLTESRGASAGRKVYTGPCKAHAAITRVSGTYRRPPQLDAEADRRELW